MEVYLYQRVQIRDLNCSGQSSTKWGKSSLFYIVFRNDYIVVHVV